MIRDVFYIGNKPNVHPREKPAINILDARRMATTEHFWLINNICDYKNFDWDFDFEVLPDEEVWTQEHINIWPSDYQKDSGTWLVPKNNSEFKIYRNDVDKVPIKNIIRENWKVLHDIDYSKFDFKWHPDPTEKPFIYVFGNQWYSGHIMPTVEYHVEGAKFHKFVNNIIAFVKQDYAVLPFSLDIFYIDKGNYNSEKKFLKLKERLPNLQKTRYFYNDVETIKRLCHRSNSFLFWVIDSETDYSDFSFDYYPDSTQIEMFHIFGTQWSDLGKTYLVNKETFLQDAEDITLIKHLPNINFVKSRKAKVESCLYDIVLIDYGNENNLAEIIEQKTKRIVNKIDYKNNLYETFVSLVENTPIKQDHYVWVISSICDYMDFDFTYNPISSDNLDLNELHVFPSDNQKYGDTFFVDMNSLRLELKFIKTFLDYPNKNFNSILKAKRIKCPEVILDETLLDCVNYNFKFPYMLFYTKDNSNLNIDLGEPIALWDQQTKTISVHSTGNSIATIPKEVKNYTVEQLYDYPYINFNGSLTTSNVMDIVFVSNKELCAENNYNDLEVIIKSLPNNLFRISNINNRTTALKEAAKLSTTLWFYCVPGKVKVNSNFDFTYQPDRLQIPKHYIFNSFNPVTGLCYGHQGIVLYNKNLVLNNPGTSLDFTLHDPHFVTNIEAGQAIGDTDSYSTWRTSFREVIKLKYNVEYLLDKESEERLEIWQSIGNGEFGKDSILGAEDAIEFYNNVNGDYNKLLPSYSWDFCLEYYKNKYN